MRKAYAQLVDCLLQELGRAVAMDLTKDAQDRWKSLMTRFQGTGPPPPAVQKEAMTEMQGLMSTMALGLSQMLVELDEKSDVSMLTKYLSGPLDWSQPEKIGADLWQATHVMLSRLPRGIMMLDRSYDASVASLLLDGADDGVLGAFDEEKEFFYRFFTSSLPGGTPVVLDVPAHRMRVRELARRAQKDLTKITYGA